MNKNFDNKEKAAAAGRKSKRGKSKEVKDLRVAVRNLLVKNNGKLEQWLDQLAEESPEKALNMFEQLTDHALPQLESSKAPPPHMKLFVSEEDKKKLKFDFFKMLTNPLPEKHPKESLDLKIELTNR